MSKESAMQFLEKIRENECAVEILKNRAIVY